MPTPLAAKTHRNLCENGCMNDIKTDWEARVAALWTHVNTLPPTEMVEAIDAFLNTGERQSSIEVWGPAEDSWPEWSTPGDPPASRPAG